MANEFLSLPTGLTEADYPSGSLIDYTPPAAVPWQAPLVPMGEDVFANYVKSQPDLLKTYNRRLARPSGTTGSLPLDTSGMPQSLSSYGLQHWNEFGSDEGRTLYPQGPSLWSDPGRNPFIPYGGTVGGEGSSAVGARLPQPSVSGYEYAYPIYSYYESPHTGESYYQPGRKNFENRMYLTQDIDKYPYFPTLPQDLAGGTRFDNQDYILVGQTLVPAGDRDDIFSY